MQSKITFTMAPNGNITKVTTNTDKLFQGQVGTIDYRLEMQTPGHVDNWRTSDVVLITFTRPDNKTSQQIMSYAKGGWNLTSNGWETDVDISQNASLKISFLCKRYSQTDHTRLVADKTTEQATCQILPSAGYSPLNIAEDDTDELLQLYGGLVAAFDIQDGRVDSLETRATDLEAKAGELEEGVAANVTELERQNRVMAGQAQEIGMLDMRTKKIIKDFTVNTLTGIGVKYYTDGTTATVNYPAGGAGGSSSKSLLQIVTFLEEHFVDGEIAFSNLHTAQENNQYIAVIDRLNEAGEVVGYNQTANTVFKGSDGSLLISGVATPFNGRVVIVGTSGIGKDDIGLGNVDNVKQMPLSYLDTDSTLSANSDARVATQKALKTYAYSKAQVNEMLGGDGLRFIFLQAGQSVMDIPIVDILPYTIYFQPLGADGNDMNFFEEYFYLTTGGVSRWELLGNTKVDLSGYLDKESYTDELGKIEGEMVRTGTISMDKFASDVDLFLNTTVSKKGYNKVSGYVNMSGTGGLECSALAKGHLLVNPDDIIYNTDEYSITNDYNSVGGHERSITIDKLVDDGQNPYLLYSVGKMNDIYIHYLNVAEYGNVTIKVDYVFPGPSHYEKILQPGKNIIPVENTRVIKITFECTNVLTNKIKAFYVTAGDAETYPEAEVFNFNSSYKGRYITDLDLKREMSPKIIGDDYTIDGLLYSAFKNIPIKKVDVIPVDAEEDFIYLIDNKYYKFKEGTSSVEGSFPASYPSDSWDTGQFGEGAEAISFVYCNREILMPLPADNPLTIYVKMVENGTPVVKEFTKPESSALSYTTADYAFMIGNDCVWDNINFQASEEVGSSFVLCMSGATSLEFISASTDVSGESEGGGGSSYEELFLMNSSEKTNLEKLAVIDTQPTQASVKLLTSGGVYDALQNVQAGQTLKTVIPFAEDDFDEGELELDPTTTGLTNDKSTITVERAVSGGYVQTANAVIKYGDGSIKLSGITAPFDGRFLIIK